MKKKHLRVERLIFVIACFVFVGIALTRIMARPDPYKQYKDVSTEQKAVGELQDKEEEISETKLRFLHYPAFDREVSDQIIADMIQKLPDAEGITFLDYESYACTDRYESVLFHYRHFDMDQQLQDEYYRGMSFDKESGALLSLSDVLRRNYKDIVTEQFRKQANVSSLDKENITFALSEESIIVSDGEHRITLAYDEFQPYIKIAGKGIAPNPLEIKRTVNVDPEKPMIAITFDDGPTPYSDEFMAVFEQYNATASFFMLGSNIAQYPDTVKHMVENGFEICNHSWDHKSIATDDKALIIKEIFDTQDAIYQLTGHEPTRIRPPYGAYNDLTYETANGNDIHITLWNVDTEDWRNRNASTTLSRAKDGAFDGAIILFHDLYPTSLEAIKEFVPYLQSQGYQLVTVSDLFKYKGEKTGL